jgi:arthrofactin-type cyclic lipopeptide synthetase C
VEAASLRYLDAMRHENIVGPVHLIGHSHGGRVAFDMALRLEASGSPVRSLTLVDTGAPEYEDHVWNVPADADIFREFVHVFERSFSVGLHVPDIHLGGASVQSFVNALHAELVRTRCLSARTSSDPVLGSLLTFMAARRHPYRAGKLYAGCVKLVVVGSHDEAEALSVDRHVALLAGWRRVAAKTDTWTGTGDHFSVLHVPHVMAMAAWWLRESVCAIDTEPA